MESAEAADELLRRLRDSLATRYSIREQLGRGGMSIVYLAEDTRHDRLVALKALRPECAATIGADRFRREIGIVARLQHPSILPLYDSGHFGTLLYYVMPYVEGETLREKLNRVKRVPVPEAVRLSGIIAGALDYAHHRNVIHRDIKPENILLHGGQPMVTDFGIALALDRCRDEGLTGAGQFLGTPHYMSPEQASGEGELDGRSDIYSLACVFFEMVAGAPPFTGPDTRMVLTQHVNSKPPNLATVWPGTSVTIANVVRRALSKAPSDRFGSAGEFMCALARCRGSLPSQRRKPMFEWRGVSNA